MRPMKIDSETIEQWFQTSTEDFRHNRMRFFTAIVGPHGRQIVDVVVMPANLDPSVMSERMGQGAEKARRIAACAA